MFFLCHVLMSRGQEYALWKYGDRAYVGLYGKWIDERFPAWWKDDTLIR